MKKAELLDLQEKITFYSKELKDLKGAKFSYAIIKNSAMLQKECEAIIEAGKSPASYLEYDQERVKLCEMLAKKDENGQPIKKNQKGESFEYDIDLTSPQWTTEFNALQEKHKAAIEENKKVKNDWIQFLNTESEIQFHKIKLEDVPDSISVEIMSLIEPFLD